LNIKRLELKSIYNVRDLGGYPIGTKGVTKWGVFLRCADLAEIGKYDMDMLFDYGIRTIINLKNPDETSNPIENDERFKYIHIPLFDDYNNIVDLSLNYNSSIYLTIVKAFKPRIKYIFDSIARHIDNGGILFHCFAGKDRTGIIAMFLLLGVLKY